MKVLFVAPEIFPLAKTGGLGDVAGSLPGALAREGCDLRLLTPAYRGSTAMTDARTVANLGDPFGVGDISLLQGTLPDSNLTVWLIDNPALFDRDGGPYLSPNGTDWPDNAIRFALLGWVAARLGQKDNPTGWTADIVHGHDWQAGLAGAYLSAWGGDRPGIVFTIHNMVFPGMFPPDTVPRVGLPWSFYTIDGFEYWNHISYLKAGIVYSDKLTTVSPTYAREIQGAPFGAGFEGLLAARNRDLTGILNGADYTVWDPSVDKHLAQHYGAATFLAGKAASKTALAAELGLPDLPDAPLLAVISRLSEQKGMDLLLSIMPFLLSEGAQLVLLGSGDKKLEAAFTALAQARPQQVAVHIGYNEPLAHRIMAGSDMLLMPSRFEPCGLTQIYAMRYGTVPVVCQTGGLADTVTDTAYDSLLTNSATGFAFEQSNAGGLQWCLERALALFANKEQWRRIQENGLRQDFSWDKSAKSYATLYRQIKSDVPTGKGRRRARA